MPSKSASLLQKKPIVDDYIPGFFNRLFLQDPARTREDLTVLVSSSVGGAPKIQEGYQVAFNNTDTKYGRGRPHPTCSHIGTLVCTRCVKSNRAYEATFVFQPGKHYPKFLNGSLICTQREIRGERGTF